VKYIEEILLLNKVLSNRVLIFNRYSRTAKILSVLPVLIAILLFGILIYKSIPERNAYYLLLFIPIFITAILSLAHNQYATQKVIEKYYSYALKKKERWDSKTILKIRKKELTKILDNKDLLKKDNILFLIETVKYHSQNKYRFNFLWNSIIILVSVLFGGFLSGQATYIKDLDQFLELYTIFAIWIGILIVMVATIDKAIIKDFFELQKESKNRLLRTLENIYLEKHTT
jgi:4-amino-4-deoxy-L-arabinose transferase-like glycosyltransferase